MLDHAFESQFPVLPKEMDRGRDEDAVQLELRVVFEGVEDFAQADFLVEMDVQGVEVVADPPPVLVVDDQDVLVQGGPEAIDFALVRYLYEMCLVVFCLIHEIPRELQKAV